MYQVWGIPGKYRKAISGPEGGRWLGLALRNPLPGVSPRKSCIGFDIFCKTFINSILTIPPVHAGHALGADHSTQPSHTCRLDTEHTAWSASLLYVMKQALFLLSGVALPADPSLIHAVILCSSLAILWQVSLVIIRRILSSSTYPTAWARYYLALHVLCLGLSSSINLNNGDVGEQIKSTHSMACCLKLATAIGKLRQCD